MKVSYSWLQSFFEEKLPKPEELAELLTMRSFEVEEVVNKGDDYILNIDILPNRAHDCLSHWGLARECAAILNSKLPPEARLARGGKIPAQEGRGSPNEVGRQNLKSGDKKYLDVKIASMDLCPRYSAYVIEDVKVKESPAWIKERLTAMNQKAINNVVDITNYVMWELGQPLHAFDLDKIHGAKMDIRLSRDGEKLETLDRAIHDLGEGNIIIEDADRIIDLAGIKGGANTQIENDTSRIIFQAAIFDPAHIRRSSQKLGIRTDAAVRYMHGFDANLPLQALDRAVELLEESNPDAKIVQKIDMYPEPVKPKKIDSLDVNYANKLLGTYLSIREMKQILGQLGIDVEGEELKAISHKSRRPPLGRVGTPTATSELKASIPTYRPDISSPEDLIEEIGRMYGYENVKAEPPRGTLIIPRRNEQVFWRGRAREILAGFGFSEVYNYSLTSDCELLELANPVSDEFRYLRTSLWPGILKNIAANSRYLGAIQIFESGKVFCKKDAGARESENLICATSSNDSSANEFYQLKGYLDELFNQLGITDFYLDHALSEEEEKCLQFLHPARRANVVLDGKKVGYIGEIHPQVREEFDVKQRVFCAEVDFGKVTASAEEEQIYQTPSKYPEVVRDIALLVPREVMVEEVLNTIEIAGGSLLRDTDLFDIYEGENLPASAEGGPEGKKNLAFHLLFQSDERTLTSQEVDLIVSKITKALEERLWEVR